MTAVRKYSLPEPMLAKDDRLCRASWDRQRAGFLTPLDHGGTIAIMPKRLPIDCRKLTAIHLTGLDDDELGMLAQRIEIQSQQLNRAMRIVIDVMSSRRRDA